MGSLTFTTTLARRGPGVAVALDADQVAVIGEGAKRFPVAGTINGETWRSTVVRMRGEFLLGLSKEVRAQVGADAGDTVEVTATLDTAERVVEVPPSWPPRWPATPSQRGLRAAGLHPPQGVRTLGGGGQERGHPPPARRPGAGHAALRPDPQLIGTPGRGAGAEGSAAPPRGRPQYV
jgi:Domain of unknown function (DUF1905)